ncbi:MAG: YhcH/YjgK/YiaL family protein [bacterium]
MILDLLSNSSVYEKLHAGFSSAFYFLRKPDLVTMSEGRYAIDGERIYAIVQEYDTRPLTEGVLETHTRFIDIQYVISGEELIGYAPLAGQAIRTPYDNDKDIAFFEGAADPIRVQQGMIAVFFPHDAHLPGRTTGAPARVRKVVIKVAVKR